jgi:predicted MFS family arabinose efflux permease
VKISRLASTTLLLLSCANFLNFFDRQVLSALAPILKDYWQLSDYQLGLLGTAFEVIYALAPVPFALLADRWLRGRVVALALTIWSGAMVVTGAAASYVMLLLGRAVLGLGQAGYGPSALAWLSDLFPPSHRSRAVSVHDLALMLGSAAGFALGGVLGVALGWRPVFFFAALPGFILAAAAWLLPEPSKGQSDYRALGIQPRSTSTTPVPLIVALRELLSVPTIVVSYAVGVLLSLATVGLIFWMPTLAVRVYGFGEDQAGLIVGAFTVLAGAAGVLSGGWVADRLLRRTPAARLLVIGTCFVLGCPLAVAAIFAPNRALFLVFGAMVVYLFTFYFPCLAPLIHQVTRPELRATSLALGLFVIHILGNAPAPALAGWLSDRTGDLRLGLAGSLIAALLAGLLALWGTRFVGRDTQRIVDHLEKMTSPAPLNGAASATTDDQSG